MGEERKDRRGVERGNEDRIERGRVEKRWKREGVKKGGEFREGKGRRKELGWWDEEGSEKVLEGGKRGRGREDIWRDVMWEGRRRERGSGKGEMGKK